MQQPAKIAVLGGNGFVGQRVSAQLVAAGIETHCFSRTGSKPVHLQGEQYRWAEQVVWRQGDGCQLQSTDLQGFDALICLVGAPPLPTFTQPARERQRALNGSANVNSIRVASAAGVERLALLGAWLPAPLRNNYWGYFLGKRDSLRAAKAFAAAEQRSATVVQPPLIIGKRYLRSGRAVPLNLLQPLQGISCGLLQSVDRVAAALVDSVLTEPQGSGFTIIDYRAL